MDIRKIIKEEIDDFGWVTKPIEVTVQPFDDNESPTTYTVTNNDIIEVGDDLVYRTASGIWRPWYGVNREALNRINNDPSYYKIIKEELDFDWVKDEEPRMVDDIYGVEIDINTEEAQKNFEEEKNGHYVIRTPKGQEGPETVLAYGTISYIKRVINYMDKISATEDSNLYFGTIKYSRREKDNVLSYIKYH